MAKRDEIYHGAKQALDRDRRKNSLGAVAGFLFIIAAVVAICWIGLERGWV